MDRAHTESPGLASHFPDPASATRQSIVVDAPPAVVYDAILGADLGASRSLRALAGIRMLPARVLRRLRREPGAPVVRRPTVVGLIDAGYWIELESHPPRELVLGLVMWDRDVERRGLTEARFRSPSQGSVRVGWSFCVEPLPNGDSVLLTETRTNPTDARARRRFRRYWRLISPFASLTRRFVLRRVAAEAAARAETRPHGSEAKVPA